MQNKVGKDSESRRGVSRLGRRFGILSKTAVFVITFSLMGLGCRNDSGIKTYRVPKEAAVAAPSAPDPMGMAPMQASGMPAVPSDAPSSHNDISWALPQGWTEVPPSSMRVGSFRVAGANGQTADMSIVPLSGMGGDDAANINRWRGQIGLAPLSAADIENSLKSISPAGRPMKLVEMASDSTRILAAIYREPNRTWFFKLMGDGPTVQAAKPAFLQFLKDLKFQGGGHE